jgi:hypothetical protein
MSQGDYLSLVFLHLIEGTNPWMSHSTVVCISPHSPYKNLETWAWGMYVVSIATLFWSPCLNSSFHTNSTFDKGDFAGFCLSMDWDNRVHPMLWMIEGITL